MRIHHGDRLGSRHGVDPGAAGAGPAWAVGPATRGWKVHLCLDGCHGRTVGLSSITPTKQRMPHMHNSCRWLQMVAAWLQHGNESETWRDISVGTAVTPPLRIDRGRLRDDSHGSSWFRLPGPVGTGGGSHCIHCPKKARPGWVGTGMAWLIVGLSH